MSEKNQKRVRDDAYYEEFSRAVEAGEYEAGQLELGPAALQRGRPVGGGKGGASPIRALRLPEQLDAALEARAADLGVTVSEVMRQAVVEYLGA